MNKESPEIKRENLRRNELNRPSSSISGSNLADLVGSFNWKATLLLILIVIIGFVVFKVLF